MDCSTLARECGAALESWTTQPPKPAMWHITPTQLALFANKVEKADLWWEDNRGASHRMTREHAIQTLKELFDVFPGGLTEIKILGTLIRGNRCSQ